MNFFTMTNDQLHFYAESYLTDEIDRVCKESRTRCLSAWENQNLDRLIDEQSSARDALKCREG